MATRREGREAALQALYQLDAQPSLSPAQGVEQLFAHLEIDRAHEEFAARIVAGVREHQAEIDALIQKSSTNWRLERMARVDRNLLRLAAWELAYARETPPKVVINEAIEIAKRYGTAESPAFINGLLDRCAKELGR